MLQAAGQTINLPAYVIPTSGAAGGARLGAARVLPRAAGHPRRPGGATFGAKFLSADLTLTGVFGPVARAPGSASGRRGKAGDGKVNAAGTVASPAAIAPGPVTLTGRKVQGRQAPRRAASRRPAPASRPAWRSAPAARRLATVTARANGTFTYAVPKASKAKTFRARAAVAGRTSRRRVRRSSARSAIPCVNPTVSGFTAQSRNRPRSVATQYQAGTGALRAPGPLERARGGDRPHRHVLAGPTTACCSAWYPRGVSTAEKRLRYYAERFDTVEVDSPYYALPDPAVTARWAQRTPDEFTFHVKASAAMTWHEGEPTDDAFRAFRAALEPLELSGKLRGVLLQYHPRFKKTRGGDGRARARARAARAARAADRVPPPLLDGGGRAGGHARVPRGARARVRLASTARARAPRTSCRASRPRRIASPTSASTAATRRPGTSAAARAPTGSTGSTRPRSSRSGSGRVQRLAEEADEVYALFNNNRDDFAPRSAPDPSRPARRGGRAGDRRDRAAAARS